MSLLPLTLACGPYDRTEALRDGVVRPEGIDLNYLAVQSPPEIFSRMTELESFDASEMSLSQYLTMRHRGDRRFLALPVFPSRVFRHGFIFVNGDLRTPKELEGRRIGVPEYWQTAAVWIRGLLANDYGVDLAACEWYEGGMDVPLSAEERRLRLARTDRFRPKLVAEDECLSDLLATGALDAVIGARKPSSVGTATGVRRLFPDYRAVEADYYRRTGIFPIMHTLVVRHAVLDRHPWVAESLFKAFTEANAWSRRQMRFSGTIRYSLPWLFHDLEEIDEVFGGDPWADGLDRNEQVVGVLAMYLRQQELVDGPIDVSSQFARVIGSTQ